MNRQGDDQMKKGNIIGHFCKFIYFFSCFSALFTMPVHAYIDPSAVTYIIQGVAGVLIALGAAFTIFRHKIFAFFKGKKKEQSAEEKIEFKDTDEENESQNTDEDVKSQDMDEDE